MGGDWWNPNSCWNSRKWKIMIFLMIFLGVFWFWVLSRKESKSSGVFECVSEKEWMKKKEVRERWKKIGKSNDKRVILVDQYVFRY
jgi:hypothetical protein